MSNKWNWKFVICFVAIAMALTVMEICVGNFPVDLFRFPLNILCLALWLVMLGIIYRQRATSTIARFMLSTNAVWLSFVLVASVGITLGLQRKPSSDAWLIVGAILFVLSHLTLITMRGWRNARGVRWRFTLLHLGLILALGAGFWGAPDREQLRIIVNEEYNNQAYNIKGESRILDYGMRLADLNIEYGANGSVASYKAEVDIDGRRATISVNNPYQRTWYEKIYLISNSNDACILEVVREPWQWLTMTGIVMLIAGAVMMFISGPRRSNIESKEQ